ncbi:DUF1302 domain-containing protein [Pseudomonas borbori]|uniref:DUF1302 domain-containing protein n=1 Tax=Pseudomonas borbori TaxID=289003 RepID=A0A1I5XB27_9PSED|nr:DUF1302 family protein [Pseudomonas borbori]SFQ29178.1 Protein of unknown function [Pseudomonas borbori]
MKKKSVHRVLANRSVSMLLVGGLVGLPGVSSAFQIETNDPDTKLQWDNTVRYNLGARVESRDSKLGNNPNYDESDYKFDKGEIVTNRLDLYSQLDFEYKQKLGFRISGSGWYDHAYRDSSVNQNPALKEGGWESSYIGDRYSADTRRNHRGLHGEVLDAFVFGRYDVGEVPVQVRVGRLANVWGEALLDPLNSISYSQSPLSFRTSLATPGATINEVFRPVGQVSMQAGLTPELALEFQYFLEWEENQFPDGGTYLGLADVLGNGPQQLPLAPGFSLPRTSDLEPSQSGEWGVALKLTPDWFDGTLGFYHRNVSEKNPWLMLTANDSGLSGYRLSYAENTELYAMSLGTNISGISVGTELIYRKNTALVSNTAVSTEGARGDTYHVIVNAIGLIGETALFDTANYVLEGTYSRWDRVRKNEDLFAAKGTAGCLAVDGHTGCVTKNFYKIAATFEPTWFSVFPSVDLSMPISYSQGISGNASTLGGGFEGQGSYSIGLKADIVKQHKVTLRYIDYLLDIKSDGAFNGDQPLSDRGWVSMTYETSF